MDIVAISFGNGKYQEMLNQYLFQLRTKNIFTKVIGYSSEDIDDEFYDHHKSFIAGSKGYGYWIWKPYFIKKTLDGLKDGDVLLYGDAASNMIGSADQCLRLINDALDSARAIKIIASKQGWNIRWIKSDLYFKLGWSAIFYAFARMAEAGRIIIQKNNQTVAFVNEWLHHATCDYHNIDDTPSRLPNLPFYVAHRADQSIFSLLFNKHKGTFAYFDDVWRKNETHYKVLPALVR